MAWLGVAGFACTATPPVVESGEPPRVARGCPLVERREQVCADLGKAEVETRDGERLKLEPAGCDVTAYGGLAMWKTLEAEPRTVAAMVKFDKKRLREQLVPERLAPSQQEWPCSGKREAEVDGKLTIRLRRPCDGSAEVAATVSLALPTRGQAGCVGASWYYGYDEHWCTTAVGAEREVYWLRKWRGFTRFEELGPLVIDGERVLLRVDDEWKHLEDSALAAEVRTQLSGLWRMPTVLEESCRDGSPTVVRALKVGGWRVVSRSCSDPVGIARLFRELAAQE